MKKDKIKELEKESIILYWLLVGIIISIIIISLLDKYSDNRIEEQILELQSQLNFEKETTKEMSIEDNRLWSNQHIFNILVQDKIGVFNRPPEIKSIEVNISG